ncbi:MAG TPA: LCP family protein [Anaerolineales bacterium]|nr:LCP family protein [Anaerolineales bacterium]
MKTGARALSLLLAIFLTGCGSLGNSPQHAKANAAPFILITPAADASPTATAFLPPAAGMATPTSLYSASVFILPSPFPDTATPTSKPAVQPTPTVDLATLFPTEAAPPPADASAADAPAPLPSLTDKDTVNFLLIGSDKRTGNSFRTDTMIVVILWPKEGQVSMISIPRDLWIYIPTVGMQRINTAFENGETNGYEGGGGALLRDTILYNLGIRIDHMAMVDFDGFRRIVDTLGGVDVPVSCPYTDWHLIDPSYDPYNANNWSLFTAQPGIDHMDGDLALWYARSRMKSNDFDRGRRQQEVLRAILQKALSTDTLSRIPQLYSDFASTINTDIGLPDMVKLAFYAPRLPTGGIRSYYIRPPYVTDWMTPAGAAVLLPNQAALEQLLTTATSLSNTAVQRVTINIDVENGTTNTGWDTLAASRLHVAGYNASVTAAADRQDYGNSMLIDFTTGQDQASRDAILNVLGVTSAQIMSAPDTNSKMQYRLIVGADYQPCFKPQDLSH